jgi:putative hydroxymethylpyrimidine transport system permease protein
MAGELSLLHGQKNEENGETSCESGGIAAKKKRLAILFDVILLVFWEVLSLIIDSRMILPGPLDVCRSLWEKRAVIFAVHLPATMYVVLIGGVLSVLFGVLMAVFMDASEIIRKTVYPILTVTQTIPTMCIAPVFVLWLGYTPKMRVLVVVLVNFFPVAVDLFDGFRSVNREQLELMDSFGAGRFYRFVHLKIPAALPYFFSALHVAVPWSVVSAAIAEWLGAPAGLGTCSRAAMMELDAAGLLAPLLVMTVTALLLNRLLERIESGILKHYK